MKRILSTITVAAFFAASCNTTPPIAPGTQTGGVIIQDTNGLATFQQWKARNELSTMTQFQQDATAQPMERTVVYVPQKTNTVYRSSGASRSSGGTRSSSSSGNAKAKKGWSKAAKGAVIGGVAGAAGGAVINKKNRAVGAVIGGVLGAGAGYGIGRGMDKRDGRF